MTSWDSTRWMVAYKVVAAIFFTLLVGIAAKAQSLSVIPVNVFLLSGQKTATLSVTNQGNSKTFIQIRAYAWNQKNGEDQLTVSDQIVISPPIVTIAPGGSQLVRLVLRQPAVGRESTYRILLDQIPPPDEPGVVHVVLRLSIPIFAEPMTHAAPHVQFHLERAAGQLFLVGINDGLRHETFRSIALSTNDGHQLKLSSSVSPYILAGAIRRWPIESQDSLPSANETLRLTAHTDAGAIDQQVHVVTIQ